MGGKQLWKGVTGVSNPGRKKGRLKRGRRKADLNRGQYLGDGKRRLIWPGLNKPMMKKAQDRPEMTHSQGELDKQRENRMLEMRDKVNKKKRPTIPPLLRGYTGSRAPGQRFGPPDAIGDQTFEGFESVCLRLGLVANKTGTMGTKMRFTAVMVTGNKNGVVGLALGQSQTANVAIRVGRNRAGMNLLHVPLYENRTVYHNMFAQVHKTKLYIHKREKGYGLVCHRVLKSVCQMLGIKDIHIKTEGSTKNAAAMAQAFFEALANQETHQELSDRTKYHVVEYKNERQALPVVVASPQTSTVEKDKLKDEVHDLEMNFERLYYEGRVERLKPPLKPFYEFHNFPSWQKRCKRVHERRNQQKALLLRQSGLW